MAGFLDILRSGDWLTLSRARLWALAVLIASAGGLVYLVATSDGLIDYQGRPLGTDFSNVYAAGTYVLDGKPAAPFDPRLATRARDRRSSARRRPSTAGTIRRSSLCVAAALALMPYQLALIVWQGVTLALYLLAIRAIVASLSPPPPADRVATRSAPGDESVAPPRARLSRRVREPRAWPQRLPHRRADGLRARYARSRGRSLPAFCSDCSPTSRSSG